MVYPRWQLWLAWGTFIGWEILVVALFLAGRRWGGGDWLLLFLRLSQGALLPWGMFGCLATVLEVVGDDLMVSTLWRKLLRQTGLRVPLSAVALEWIGDQLTMQRPDDGLNLPLGRGPAARRAADWLVARGIRPPVGG